ncbi:MAG: DUF4422 domain-containing protein [Lachnospiraceae bacterium]|nr:DUF4422 domain-containing protein [Lachnospiraceae bacterium]
MLDNLNEFIKSLEEKKVYVYGAKGQPWYVYNYLRLKGVSVEGFVVTSSDGNPTNVDGLPVIPVEKYEWDENSVILVSFQFRSKPFNSVFELLVEKSINNVIFIPNPMYTEMVNTSVEMAFDKGCLSIEKDLPVEKDHSIFAYKDDNGDKYYWRFAYREFVPKKLDDMRSLFAYRTPITEFQDTYGSYYELKRLRGESKSAIIKKDIYMARSHADRDTGLADKNLKDWIVPIQVGAALTDKSIYDLKDNSGDNISAKNGNFSEATAIYWMWKNAPETDYIGLNHYRRQIDIKDDDWGRIADNDIDVIVTRPTFVPQGNGAFFASLVPKCDVDFFNRAVEEVAPRYSKARDAYMTARFYPPCNIYVMKYEHFMDYAKLVFDVVFRVENMYEDMGFVRKDRYMGYLVEALLGIWLIEHKEKIKISYTDMIFLEK